MPSDAEAYPNLSTVAAKKPFASASAAAAKDALGAKDIPGARKLIDRPGAFYGTVRAVYPPARHAVVILDFDPDYRQALTATVKPTAYAELPGLTALKGKHVSVSGTFETDKGRPEIEISDAV